MPEPKVPSKLASKPVNLEFIQGLEVLENQVYPLQGAVGRRHNRDARLGTYVGGGAVDTGTVCYYEHMTTIRHRTTGAFFIVFRETKDAQLADQADIGKYPKWLMDHPVKDDERRMFIHMAKPNAPALLRKGVASIAEWLDPIENTVTFDSIAYFLLRAGLWTEKMYGSYQ